MVVLRVEEPCGYSAIQPFQEEMRKEFIGLNTYIETNSYGYRSRVGSHILEVV